MLGRVDQHQGGPKVMETGKPTKQANPLSPVQMSSQLLFVSISCFTDKIASYIAATAPV